MIVGVVVVAVLVLIVIGSIVGARRGTPQSFVASDEETDRARIYYQGNGNSGIGGSL
jgi:hypothetical protein